MDTREAARVVVRTMGRIEGEGMVKFLLDPERRTITVRNPFEGVGGEFTYEPKAFSAWDRRWNLQPMFDQDILDVVVLADREGAGVPENEVYATLDLRGRYNAGGEFIGDEDDQHYVYRLHRLAKFINSLNPDALPLAADAIRDFINEVSYNALENADYRTEFEEENY